MHSSTSRSRARSRRAIAIGSSILLAGVLAIAPAFAATHPAKNFHSLDGFVVDQSALDPPYDWDDFFNSATTAEPTKKTLPTGAISSDFTRDFLTNTAGTVYANGDDTYFATGSKDTLPITDGWQCKHTNNATDKGDFVNGYGYAANVSVSGSNHIIFFFGLEKDDDNGTNNLGFWLLQDENVACLETGGGNTDFAGDHLDNDLLAVISYDSGGTIGTAKGFLWDGDENDGGSLNTTPAFESTQANCNSTSIEENAKFCITTNAGGTRSTPWWSPQKGDKTTSAALQKNVFVEGFIDITNVFSPGNEPCFAKGLADTRASTSPTASLYDFLQIEAPTCGPLVIKKYYDKNFDGNRVQGDPPTEDPNEPFLPDWDFKVFADGADPLTDDPIYEVTTGADGSVTIPDVPFGNYDIYEVLEAGYYNTDPGNVAMKKDVLKTSGTNEVIFGNACLVDKTFNVNGAPTGANLALTYRINDGSEVTVNMTGSGTTKTYTLNDTLKPSDRIGWSYAYQSGGPSGTVTVVANDPANPNDGESMSDFTDTAGDGSTCAKTNNTNFPYVTLSGTKYKDKDADGTKDVNDPATPANEADEGIAGFDFVLHSGTVDGTQVGTATSVADGTYSFTGVTPGTYWVTESAETGWQQTAPTGGTPQANARQVIVTLGGGNQTIGDFLNAPLTDISITVSPDTTSSYGNISCTRNGSPVGTDTDGTQGTAGDDDTWTLNNQLVGQYVCTIDIIDP